VARAHPPQGKHRYYAYLGTTTRPPRGGHPRRRPQIAIPPLFGHLLPEPCLIRGQQVPVNMIPVEIRDKVREQMDNIEVRYPVA
jgi:hypothetical protein